MSDFVFVCFFFSVDTFKAFVEDYFAGNLQPYIKSEPVPEDNDGPVKVKIFSGAKSQDTLPHLLMH